MSTKQHQSPESPDNYVIERSELIRAHFKLVQMQQSLLQMTKDSGDRDDLTDSQMVRTISRKDEPSLVNWNVESDNPSAAQEPSSIENTSSSHSSRPSNPEQKNADALKAEVSYLTKHGLSLLLPLILGIMVLALLFKSPREVSELRGQLTALKGKFQEEISRTSIELKETQNSLRQAQGVLASTEQALRDSQKQNLSEDSTKPTGIDNRQQIAYVPNTQVRTVEPESAEEKLLSAQKELLNIRASLVANKKELIINEQEYVVTIRSLAKNKMILNDLNLEEMFLTGKINAEEMGLKKKLWDSFIGSDVRLKYPDLVAKIEDESTQDVSSNPDVVPSESMDEAHQTTTIPEVRREIINSSKNLLDAIKRIKQIQYDIQLSQGLLTTTLAEIDVKEKRIAEIKTGTALSSDKSEK